MSRQLHSDEAGVKVKPANQSVGQSPGLDQHSMNVMLLQCSSAKDKGQEPLKSAPEARQEETPAQASQQNRLQDQTPASSLGLLCNQADKPSGGDGRMGSGSWHLQCNFSGSLAINNCLKASTALSEVFNGFIHP
ncbi:hypothetical protein AAES_135082 [Amazona aestiva]|uniref:Uncharacterized protein n=1 Tax=Amazona aestiva TaxID=12930 RepID=A0A0Q3QTJ5_AMAAE|nr:hypothetical protein AAES_135082 [Amazona aestiva]